MNVEYSKEANLSSFCGTAYSFFAICGTVTKHSDKNSKKNSKEASLYLIILVKSSYFYKGEEI